MKNALLFYGIIFIGLLLFAIEPFAQQADTEKGQVTVSWEEFKQLLNLDENKLVIPLDTFQKLLRQTGVESVPSYTIENGHVVLSRKTFQKLVDQMKPPTGSNIEPPFEYLITKSIYSGKMKDENTHFTGLFTVHVLKENVYVKIPVLSQTIALEDIRLNDKPALVVSKNGYHNVVVDKAGEHTVTLGFSMKSHLDRGPQKLDLAIQQTPITLFNMEIPLKDIDVDIPQATQISTRSTENKTMVNAVISPGRQVTVQWRKKLAVTEKIPAKLYANVYHLISIEDDLLRIDSDIHYNILHSEVDAVQITLADTMNVLSVTGDGVGEWQEINHAGTRRILVPFTYGKKGRTMVHVKSEVPLGTSGQVTAFKGFQLLDTERETGHLGIALNTSAEVTVPESAGLEKVAPQKLPATLINKSTKPLMMGFKYLKHPFSLVLDITKHEKVNVPLAAINSANVVTLFTEDGKVVHRMIYQVRNSAKQFLHIQLPPKADVWSVFVDNQPVESSLNQSGTLLIPLIRSKTIRKTLQTFPVEVIIAFSKNRFAWMGAKGNTLPAVDLMISQLIWSVYLPNGYAFNYFTSTLEKEKIIRGVNLFSGARRRYDQSAMNKLSERMDTAAPQPEVDELSKAYKGKAAQSSFKNVPMEEKEMASQMAVEMGFGGRMEGMAQQAAPMSPALGTGLLPITIHIPTSGQLYRFARTIIKPEDPLTFNVYYTQLWLVESIKTLFVILLIFIVFIIIKKDMGPWRWLKKQSQHLKFSYSKHESTLKGFAQSKLTLVLLFILVVVFWGISGFITLILILLFLAGILYQLKIFIKDKRKGGDDDIILAESEKPQPRQNQNGDNEDC